MRSFNNREQAIIAKLLAKASGQPVALAGLFEELLFSQEEGRALIIQNQDRYAVFFLSPSLFDNEDAKAQQIKTFIESISLIHYLNKEAYITVCREKTEKMYFLQDGFDRPVIEGKTLVLNTRGDYSASPTTIHDKHKNTIYKGITFEGDTWSLIINTVIGMAIINDSLATLLPGNTAAATEIPAATTSKQMQPAPQKQSRRHLILWAVSIVAILAILALTLFLHFDLKKNYESRIDLYRLNKDSIGQLLDSLKKAVAQQATPIAIPVDTLPQEFYYGIDISKWNGGELEALPYKDSITFVICKATEGVDLVDPRLSKNWQLMKQRNYISGAYHFYRVAEDPVAQANHLWQTLRKLGKADIAPTVDIEQESLVRENEQDIATVQAGLLLFLKRLQTLCNRTPIIYTDYAFANQYLTDTTFSRYPLWLAEYTHKDAPSVPVAWKQAGCKIWQRKDNYYIDSEPTDFDIFYGPKERLYD